MLRLPIVKTVFRKELREMLRDRRSLAVMFGVPLVLYPVLTLALSTIGFNKIQSMKGTRDKVAVVNADAAPELVRLIEAARDDKGEPALERVPPPADPLDELRSGRLFALVDVPPGFENDLLARKNPKLTARYDLSRMEAGFTRDKLNRVLAQYQLWVIERRLGDVGAPRDVARPIDRTIEDVATASGRMGQRLGQMLPLLILITGMLGALFPALSATTTERELGTLETLLVTPAGRAELLLAKGALVLCCGIASALINMVSMSLVLWRVSSVIEPGAPTSLPHLGVLVLTFVAALPAIAFFTAMVLIVGLLARTFREANSYATPAMLLPLASLALSIADVKPTLGLLVTPIASTTLVMRDILRGNFVAFDFTLAFASSLLYSGLLLSVASRLFSNEQLVNPAWEPLSLKGLGRRGRSRGPRLPAVDEAIAVFALSLLLLFYVQPSLTGMGLFGMLAVTQLVIVFGPAALFAVVGRWDWRATFKLVWPRPGGAVGGALLGLGLVPVVILLSNLQARFWPASPEMQKMARDLFLPSLKAHPVWTPLIVGALAGVFEELLFRGPIQTALMRRSSPRLAIGVTAVLFAAAHLDLHGLAIRALLGCVLGWVVWRTGSIVPGMLLHGLYDAGQVGLWAAQVRGGVADGDSPAVDGWAIGLLALGVVMAAGGAWLVRGRREVEVKGVAAAG